MTQASIILRAQFIRRHISHPRTGTCISLSKCLKSHSSQVLTLGTISPGTGVEDPFPRLLSDSRWRDSVESQLRVVGRKWESCRVTSAQIRKSGEKPPGCGNPVAMDCPQARGGLVSFLPGLIQRQANHWQRWKLLSLALPSTSLHVDFLLLRSVALSLPTLCDSLLLSLSLSLPLLYLSQPSDIT